jgi:hypothetical protein
MSTISRYPLLSLDAVGKSVYFRLDKKKALTHHFDAIRGKIHKLACSNIEKFIKEEPKVKKDLTMVFFIIGGCSKTNEQSETRFQQIFEAVVKACNGCDMNVLSKPTVDDILKAIKSDPNMADLKKEVEAFKEQLEKTTAPKVEDHPAPTGTPTPSPIKATHRPSEEPPEMELPPAVDIFSPGKLNKVLDFEDAVDEVELGPPNTPVSAPKTRRAALDFFKSEDPNDKNPFYFCIPTQSLSDSDVQQLIEALRAANLIIYNELNDEGEKFITINVINDHIFSIYQRIIKVADPLDFRLYCWLRGLLEKINALEGYVNQYPELAHFNFIAVKLEEDLAEIEKKKKQTKMVDSGTSPMTPARIILSPLKRPKKVETAETGVGTDASPVKQPPVSVKPPPVVDSSAKPKSKIEKSQASEKVNEPAEKTIPVDTVSVPKKGEEKPIKAIKRPGKPSFLSRFFTTLASPFKWLWAGFRSILKRIFGK